MNLLFREKRDGRRALGYPVYLLAGLAGVAAILFFRGRTRPPAASAPLRGPSGSVAAITRSAAEMAPVNVPGKSSDSASARSFRLKKRKQPGAGEAEAAGTRRDAPGLFDAIAAALAAPPREEAGAKSPFALLAPALAEAKVEQNRDLVGYRDSSADAPPAGVNGSQDQIVDAAPVRAMVPRGTLMPVVLLTTMDTGNAAAVIQLAVARTITFHGRRQLPFGTRMVGRLTGRPVRGRLNLTADTVLFPDGREVPVNATAVEADRNGRRVRPGVAAEFFPPPAWAQLAPYLAESFGGFMGLMESRAQSQFSLGLGGLSLQGSSPAAVRAPLYQAGSQAVQDFAQARLKEIEDRYAAYYLVPAGTEFWLQLEADLALGRTPADLPLSNPSPVHAAPAPP